MRRYCCFFPVPGRWVLALAGVADRAAEAVPAVDREVEELVLAGVWVASEWNPAFCFCGMYRQIGEHIGYTWQLPPCQHLQSAVS